MRSSSRRVSRRTAEQNDGPHPGTGLPTRSTVDLSWSRAWLRLLAVDERAEAETEHAEDIATIDAAEVRYLACSPEARDAADEWATAAYIEAAYPEWDDTPRLHAAMAEVAEAHDAGEPMVETRVVRGDAAALAARARRAR